MRGLCFTHEVQIGVDAALVLWWLCATTSLQCLSEEFGSLLQKKRPLAEHMLDPFVHYHPLSVFCPVWRPVNLLKLQILDQTLKSSARSLSDLCWLQCAWLSVLTCVSSCWFKRRKRDKTKPSLICFPGAFKPSEAQSGALAAEMNAIGVNICISAVDKQCWGQSSGIPALFRDHCCYSWAFLGKKGGMRETGREGQTPRGRKLSTNSKTKEEIWKEVWSLGREMCICHMPETSINLCMYTQLHCIQRQHSFYHI